MRSKIVLGAVGLMLAGTALTACGSGDSSQLGLVGRLLQRS